MTLIKKNTNNAIFVTGIIIVKTHLSKDEIKKQMPNDLNINFQIINTGIIDTDFFHTITFFAPYFDDDNQYFINGEKEVIDYLHKVTEINMKVIDAIIKIEIEMEKEIIISWDSEAEKLLIKP